MNILSKNKVKQSEYKTILSASAHNFPLVGIGAAAGGLDGFKQLLKAIAVDAGTAYVLVQHLNPAHESTLPKFVPALHQE